jgi:hypothetical protein
VKETILDGVCERLCELVKRERESSGDCE